MEMDFVGNLPAQVPHEKSPPMVGVMSSLVRESKHSM